MQEFVGGPSLQSAGTETCKKRSEIPQLLREASGWRVNLGVALPGTLRLFCLFLVMLSSLLVRLELSKT
jgi:hypothetical protein